MENLLEDGVKLSIVASDIFIKSGRDMLDALTADERERRVLAELARRWLRIGVDMSRSAHLAGLEGGHGT